MHREQIQSALPDDLAEEWHALSEWVLGVAHRYGSRVTVRLVDVASMEGFFKSLFRRLRRYPAFIVNGRKYVGSDFSRVDALISESLTTPNVEKGDEASRSR